MSTVLEQNGVGLVLREVEKPEVSEKMGVATLGEGVLLDVFGGGRKRVGPMFLRVRVDGVKRFYEIKAVREGR